MLLEVVTLMVAGLMVGTELSVALFVHPTLSRLPDHVHLPAAIALARLLGRVMPAWYATTTLLTVTLAFIQWQRTSSWPPFHLLSAALWVLAIVFSVTALVPINNKIASWTEASRPADWRLHREQWDSRHQVRVMLLSAAFIALAMHTVSQTVINSDLTNGQDAAGGGFGWFNRCQYTVSISTTKYSLTAVCNAPPLFHSHHPPTPIALYHHIDT